MTQLYRRSEALPAPLDISLRGMDNRITIPEGTQFIELKEERIGKCGVYFRTQNGMGNGCEYVDSVFLRVLEEELKRNSYAELDHD